MEREFPRPGANTDFDAHNFVEHSHDIHFPGGFVQILICDTETGPAEAAESMIDIAAGLAITIQRMDLDATESSGRCQPIHNVAAALQLILGIAGALISDEIRDNPKGGSDGK